MKKLLFALLGAAVVLLDSCANETALAINYNINL